MNNNNNNNTDTNVDTNLENSNVTSGGAIMNMGVDFKNNVLPTLPTIIECPLCDEKHEKKNLIYATNMLRSRFRSKYKDGIRVRSYKTPSVLRTDVHDYAASQIQQKIFGTSFLSPSDFLGTCFYFCCNNCSYMFEYRNQKSEKQIREKLFKKKKISKKLAKLSSNKNKKGKSKKVNKKKK